MNPPQYLRDGPCVVTSQLSNQLAARTPSAMCGSSCSMSSMGPSKLVARAVSHVALSHAEG